MFESRIITETAAELRGLYRPGFAPQAELSETFDANPVLVHENAHRVLFESSTLGHYASTLAFVAERALSEEERMIAAADLAAVCEQCWCVQEGYATYKQSLYISTSGGDLSAFDTGLLASYRRARSRYGVLDLPMLQRLLQIAWDERPLNDAEMLIEMSAGIEIAATVIALAAMSIPLDDLLQSCSSLPDIRVLAHIRRYSPDLRLDCLAVSMDTVFAYKCYLRMVNASKGHIDGLMKRKDQALTDLATELGDLAGIKVESAHVISIPPVLLAKFGPTFGKIDFRDMTKLTFPAFQSIMSRTVFNSAEELVKPPGSFDRAKSVYADTMTIVASNKSHVVCELCPHPSGEDGKPRVLVFLHLYARFQNPTKQFPAGANIVALICTTTFVEQLNLLPHIFPSPSWSWLLPDFGFTSSVIDVLATEGPVFRVRTNPESSEASHDEEYPIPADPIAVELEHSLTPHIRLVMFKKQAKASFTTVDLMPIMWANPQISGQPSFEVSCLGNALKHGYLRGLFTHMRKEH